MKREAEQTWAAERVENALLRERINDIAAEIARLTVALEGTNSPIEAMLASEPTTGAASAAPSTASASPRRRRKARAISPIASARLQLKASRVPRTELIPGLHPRCQSHLMRPRGAAQSTTYVALRCLASPPRACAATLTLISTCGAAEDAEIAHRRAMERKTFTDAEIIDGFFKVTFGAEFGVSGGVDRIRKYDGPIRVYVDNRANPNRSEQVAKVVADIRARIRDLDLAMTAKRNEAKIVVSLVRDRDLAHTIRTLYGIDRARRIQRSLEPQCLSGFRKDENFRILHSDVTYRRRRRRFRVLRLHL